MGTSGTNEKSNSGIGLTIVIVKHLFAGSLSLCYTYSLEYYSIQ